LLVNDCQTHDIANMLANGTPAATICSYVQTNVPDAANYSCSMWNNIADFSASDVSGVDAMWPAHKGVYFDFYTSSGASVQVWNQWWNY